MSLSDLDPVTVWVVVVFYLGVEAFQYWRSRHHRKRGHRAAHEAHRDQLKRAGIEHEGEL